MEHLTDLSLHDSFSGLGGSTDADTAGCSGEEEEEEEEAVSRWYSDSSPADDGM